MSSLAAKLGCALIIMLAAFAVLVPTLCPAPANLTGTWTGARKIAADPDADPAALKTLSKVELTILPNGRFRLFERGLPKSGTVRYSPTGADLTINEIVGQPLHTQPSEVQEEFGQIELVIEPDGSLIYTDSKRPEPLKLVKAVNPSESSSSRN